MAKLSMGRSSKAARDWALRKQAARIKMPEVIWNEDEIPAPAPLELKPTVQAAE
jgi:multidrug efflux pump